MSDDLITITREDMAKAATSSWGVGYVHAQVKLLKGIGIHTSKKHWLKNMVGKAYPREWWERFVAAGAQRRAVKYSQEAVPLEAGPVNFFKSQEKQRESLMNRNAIRSSTRRKSRFDMKAAEASWKAGVERFRESVQPAQMKVHERTVFVAKDKRDELFADPVYKVVRAAVLRQAPWCKLCGRRPPDVALHVDHIIPLTVDWSRRMDPNNLQVLCADCNIGKSNYWS